jgi:hypothetical protein
MLKIHHVLSSFFFQAQEKAKVAIEGQVAMLNQNLLTKQEVLVRNLIAVMHYEAHVVTSSASSNLFVYERR